MKRIRFLLIILMSVFYINAEAGDTLTRAQVYNFNVGDTFDYCHYNLRVVVYVSVESTLVISYSRYVVSNIYWSTDTLTKYIVRNQLYPSMGFDTLVLTDLQGFEVLLNSCPIINTSSLPNYFGRKMNSDTYGCSTNPVLTYYFAEGLGEVIISQSSFYPSIYYKDSTVLIYYSGDSGTYGAPYTSFPNGITNIPANESIRLYPTQNDGTFTLDVGDRTKLPFDFSIYDMEGRKSMELMVNDKTNVIHADGLSNGLYIWNISADGNPLQKGKIVIDR